MNSRERILARLRSKEHEKAPETRDTSPTSVWTMEEKIRRFSERLQAVRAEVHLTSHDTWPDLVWQLCEKKGIHSLLYAPGTSLAPRLTETDQRQSASSPIYLTPFCEPIEHWKERLFFDTDAAITTSLGGIAETGSLILWPSDAEPRLMSLVPPVHFVLLEAATLHSTFAEAIQHHSWPAPMPTNVLLISGPSKSADIEQTLAYGVHGPKELIVLIVE